jgi:hypothetical protein
MLEAMLDERLVAEDWVATLAAASVRGQGSAVSLSGSGVRRLAIGGVQIVCLG